MRKFAETLTGLSAEQSEKEYQRLLASRNQMKANNDYLSKFSSRVNEAVTALAIEASVAFQAMAEKAGVRNHPSVSAAVAAFDGLMHQQWKNKERPKFPTDWNFDPTPEMNEGAGDADMMLNSKLEAVFEKTPPWESEKLTRSEIESFFREAEKTLREIRVAAGFRPTVVSVPTSQIREIGMVLLDAAQQMEFARKMLRRDLRAAQYRQISEELYRLVWWQEDEEKSKIDITVFGDVEPF